MGLRPHYMDVFRFVRNADESGVSGVGVVAHGVRFPGGRCVVHWLTEVSSVAVYADIREVQAIHSHGGRTRIVWDERERLGGSPWGRGSFEAALDNNEGAHEHIIRIVGGALPDWICRESDAYQAEYLDGYRFTAAGLGYLPEAT